MRGKLVCGQTTLENATTIRDAYRQAGFKSAKLTESYNGTWQVVVVGSKNRKITATGVCNSFGRGVPRLKDLSLTYTSRVAKELHDNEGSRRDYRHHT